MKWDHSTSIPELMDSLDILVKQGKVLYLGASDMPAWIVSACNEYAKYVFLSSLIKIPLTHLGHITRLSLWYSKPCGMRWSKTSFCSAQKDFC